MSILNMKNVSYNYKNSKEKILRDVNANFELGKFYAIVGKSGVGKSTFLSLLAGLDVPVKGEIQFEGVDISKKGYSHHRRKQVSLVFQNYNLIDYLTPMENVRLVNKKANKEILLELGLDESQINRNIMKLSGGQQQRIAIARAIAKDVDLILADEPTGNLDEKNSKEILKTFIDLAHQANKCIIIVTHSPSLAQKCDVQLKIEDGQIIEI